MADLFQFAYNPFSVQQRQVPMFDMGDSSGLSSGIPRSTEQYYELSPELQRQNEALFNNWTTKGNFQLMPYVEGQAPQFRVKSGDKEGTLYSLQPDGQGGYVAAPQGTSNWDTNDQLRQWGPFLPLAALGGASLISGLSGTGFGGAGLAEGAAGAAGAAEAMPSFANVTSGVSSTAPITASNIPGAITAASGAGALEKAFNTGAAPSLPSTPSPQQSSGLLDMLNKLVPSDTSGLLKALIPALGGLGLAYEANKNDGKQQPQDPFTRDWARGLLQNPQANPATSGLLNKRYY